MVMALRLTRPDGTTVVVGASASSVPSKRSTKGPHSMKRYNSYRSLAKVGGASTISKAIYHGYENGTTNYDTLCHVVDPSKKVWTNDIGGSSPCGYRGGRGA